jgi:glutamine amidotransferase
LVRERAAVGTPLLGICVGMQMLFEVSDEFGTAEGLGLLAGRVRKFETDLVVPQVGWNRIQQKQRHRLFDGVDDRSFCYFVHSYYCEPSDTDSIVGETEYGVRYASVVAKEKVCGVQFHPEKSQDVGLRMLKNFCSF